MHSPLEIHRHFADKVVEIHCCGSQQRISISLLKPQQHISTTLLARSNYAFEPIDDGATRLYISPRILEKFCNRNELEQTLTLIYTLCIGKNNNSQLLYFVNLLMLHR
jgi:hypothetical protein